jgi:TetR/AcrR family transcriptional repressor of nem operon
MKVTREQAAHNRERVLEAASRLFREKGFDGIGVADIMKDAGLTHGGFYAQFESKEDLAAQACARVLEASARKWDRLIETNPKRPLRAIVESYLSAQHCAKPGGGCALAALGAEAPRHQPAVRHAFTEGVRAFVARLEQVLPQHAARRRRKALASMASLVGAVVLARAVDDDGLSGEILDAVKASL